ncbi:purine nucleoside phosphorylase isoform X2 [Teleopsis dalmanni]|uniref:purine nucleoside phosphorylase isoform X2 n=1 Tax=Teleopsis dalmanni TaxID=139649 RepID=UPI0018CD0F4E|nr:purine nucleoside phosphorylase isoform X2 [Teleopsis dalmanni]
MTGFKANASDSLITNNNNENLNSTRNTYTARENSSYSYEVIKDIADYLLNRTEIRPKIGIICGSGLNSLADGLLNTQAFDYEDIPNFPVSTVEGHVGRLIFGYIENMPVIAMQGRFHYYEGYPLAKCSMPIRVMKLLGIKFLLATNAAGGLNPKFKVGDIMIVRDHINIMGFAGNSPLQGPNDPRFGPRFPPMTNAYNANLINKAKQISKELGIENNVHEGVYTCLGGPNYETVAELKMLHIMGVDAVGMSTVHEVITARHCDLTVFAFSLITNKCALEYDCDEDDANHEEVVMVGKSRQSICAELMRGIIREIFSQSECKNDK